MPLIATTSLRRLPTRAGRWAFPAHFLAGRRVGGFKYISVQATPSTDSTTIDVVGRSTSASTPGTTLSFPSRIFPDNHQTPLLKSLVRHTHSSAQHCLPRKISSLVAAPSLASPPPTLPTTSSPPSASSHQSAACLWAYPSSINALPRRPQSPFSSQLSRPTRPSASSNSTARQIGKSPNAKHYSPGRAVHSASHLRYRPP